MKDKYKVNSIYKNEGVALNEVMNTFLISFLDREFNNIGIFRYDN